MGSPGIRKRMEVGAPVGAGNVHGGKQDDGGRHIHGVGKGDQNDAHDEGQSRQDADKKAHASPRRERSGLRVGNNSGNQYRDGQEYPT